MKTILEYIFFHIPSYFPMLSHKAQYYHSCQKDTDLPFTDDSSIQFGVLI